MTCTVYAKNRKCYRTSVEWLNSSKYLATYQLRQRPLFRLSLLLSGVFNVDDDKLISQQDLEHAFQVWMVSAKYFVIS